MVAWLTSCSIHYRCRHRSRSSPIRRLSTNDGAKMARYAGGGKNTVEGCRSIDVLRWNKHGYLLSPRWFSWAWTSDGERVASIDVETQRHSVTLKYRSRSYG